MSNPLISVIVPIYKVENYLDKCVQSIVDQTYTNLEIILVDDGSPDNCGAMSDAWAEKDNRIRVIHKENGGLSDARNAGMAVATGALMGFIDSDDYIAPNMYQLLYEKMREDDSDIAACGVQMVWEDDTPPRMLTKQGECVLTTEEAMRAVIEESWLKQPVWYKLYKTEFIRDISFPKGKYHEDVFWTYKAVAHANKVSVIDTPCYHYVQRGESIMGEAYSLKRLDAIEANTERVSFIKRKFPSLMSLAITHMVGICMYHSQLMTKWNDVDPDGKQRKHLHQMAKALKKECGVAFEGSTKQKLWLKAYLMCPKLVCGIRNGLGIGI